MKSTLAPGTLVRAADNARKVDPQLARIYYVQMVERGKDHLGAMPALESGNRDGPLRHAPHARLAHAKPLRLTHGFMRAARPEVAAVTAIARRIVVVAPVLDLDVTDTGLSQIDAEIQATGIGGHGIAGDTQRHERGGGADEEGAGNPLSHRRPQSPAHSPRIFRYATLAAS